MQKTFGLIGMSKTISAAIFSANAGSEMAPRRNECESQQKQVP